MKAIGRGFCGGAIRVRQRIPLAVSAGAGSLQTTPTSEAAALFDVEIRVCNTGQAEIL